MSDILIIAATTRRRSEFARSNLGASLKRLAFDPRIQCAIACQNTRPLPIVFNAHIVPRNRNRILVFTHDDVRIDDYWLTARLDDGLRCFDVIGVAGNRRRVRDQPAWAFTADMTWDDARHLSGAVCHQTRAGESVSLYGAAPRACQLLDGVFLAVKARRLLERDVRFDDRFAFHFYDLDFCRTAVEQGLTLGTWPIAITHDSGGAFGSPQWQEARVRYRAKWKR